MLKSHKDNMAELEAKKAQMKAKFEMEAVSVKAPKKESVEELEQTNIPSDVEVESDYLPSVPKRNFNEMTMIGDVLRDDKGNVNINKEGDGVIFKDFMNRPINEFGYLVDPETGNLLETRKNRVMFDKDLLDESGHVPMPFCVEKYNFNPFELQGDLTFKNSRDPNSFVLTQKGGKLFDKSQHRVSRQGFLLDERGNYIDRKGRKMFDAKQFAPFGGLFPQLYIYSGKKFHLLDIMGIFDRDKNGNIKILRKKDKTGKLTTVDKSGHLVNTKGYLVNSSGHITTRTGKKLFHRDHLKNNEPPKFFPFTRFDAKKITGEFDQDADGLPNILKSSDGLLMDNKGRTVTKKGYLCDSAGNVIDKQGNVMFEKNLLDSEGDIPELFRLQVLRSDS